MSLAGVNIVRTPLGPTPGAGLFESARHRVAGSGGAGALGLCGAVDFFFGEGGTVNNVMNVAAMASIFVPTLIPIVGIFFAAKGLLGIFSGLKGLVTGQGLMPSLMQMGAGAMNIYFALPGLQQVRSAFNTARAASVTAIAQPGVAFSAEAQRTVINNFRNSVHAPVAQEFKTAGSELIRNLRLGNNPASLSAATIQQTQGRLATNINTLGNQVAGLRNQAATLQQQVTQATAQNTTNDVAQRALDTINRRLANSQRAFANTQARLRALEENAIRLQRAEAALRNSRTQLNTLEQGLRTQTTHTIQYDYQGGATHFFEALYGNNARLVNGVINRSAPYVRDGYNSARNYANQAGARFNAPAPVPAPHVPASVPVPPPVPAPVPQSVGAGVNAPPVHLL